MKTIHILLIFIFIFGINITSPAQTSKFNVGVEGGPSLIFLRGVNEFNQGYHGGIGFSGGLFLQYNFSKRFSLRTNVAFDRKGAGMTLQLTDVIGNPISKLNARSNFDYLTLPVLLRATFGRRTQFFLNAGPFVGYLISRNFVIKDDNWQYSPINSASLYKRFDTGISGGFGVLIPVGSKFAISIEGRNNFGLFTISQPGGSIGGPVQTNSSNLLIGFTYKLGKANQTPANNDKTTDRNLF